MSTFFHIFSTLSSYAKLIIEQAVKKKTIQIVQIQDITNQVFSQMETEKLSGGSAMYHM